MKTKLVLWGNNENDERVLIAMQLRPESNLVDIWTFPQSVATDEFAQKMMDEWRLDKEVTLPDEHSHQERELTVTDSLLPDDLRVENTDLIQRAQTEWHFIVLSSKLHQTYQSELDDLKDRIENLERFDRNLWDNLKEFWAKVQDQVRDQNLFREHANSLRDATNNMFAKMKELRNKMDQEFSQRSKDTKETFMEMLEDVENRIEEGSRLQGMFDELKKLQRHFRDSKLTRDDRAKVWERLDAAFKAVKEKRFGPDANTDATPLQRIDRRYKGLMDAIQKMQRSIKRDEDDLNFQHRKIASTHGQLEAQIRQAKIKMIEERVRSKKDKLNEMNKTKAELDKKMEGLQEKEAQKEEQRRRQEAEAKAKQEIAQQIKEQNEALKKDSDKLEKAAEAIVGSPTPEPQESPETEPNQVDEPESLGTTIREAIEDVVDTVKAVAEVVGDRIEETIEELVEGEEEEEEDKKETPTSEDTSVATEPEKPAAEPGDEEKKDA